MKTERGGLTDFLLKHQNTDPVPLHMPGHKGRHIYEELGYGDFLSNMMDCDITEIPGADTLFTHNGVIGETMKLYENLYGVKKSFMLVNGTSGGIIASILTAVPRGGDIIVSRNCHKAVYNALRLGDMKASYVYPEVHEEYGIAGPVSAEAVRAAFAQNPQAAAFVLPSPNYYGVCSDIKAIADVVHEFGAILIVDQAHGAHLKMMEGICDLPLSSESSGADIVINSTHKTLTSFTQSAIVNINSEGVDLDAFEDNLQIIESSSPSYLLMASLDINARILAEHGKMLAERWIANVEYFYDNIKEIPGIKVMRMPGLDYTKLNIDMSRYGLDGGTLSHLLQDKGIFTELSTDNLLMCMTGIGTTRRHIERLLEALGEIAAGRRRLEEQSVREGAGESAVWNKKRRVYSLDEGKRCDALTADNLDEQVGKLATKPIIPYPPGIPLICPGEVIERDDVDYLKKLIAEKREIINIAGVK